MKLTVVALEGEIEYSHGLMLQESALHNIIEGDAYDTLILLRHKPAITLGYFAKRRNILASDDSLMKQGIQVYRTDRGGDVTYHGPGQLIGYPIINISRRQLKGYKSTLCRSIIEVLEDYGIEAVEGHKRLSGIWVGDKKIAAIGYAIKKIRDRERSKVITMHGFALYVRDEMEQFRYINPCGMPDMKLTNMERVLRRPIEFKELQGHYVRAFANVFNYDIDE
jgi:lipoyl(octanoyl) transferase